MHCSKMRRNIRPSLMQVEIRLIPAPPAHIPSENKVILSSVVAPLHSGRIIRLQVTCRKNCQ